MKIEVLFFAELAEIFGPRRAVEAVDGSSVAAVAERLLAESPRVEAVHDSLVYAVNEQYQTSDTILRSGDCLAILTPMAGG